MKLCLVFGGKMVSFPLWLASRATFNWFVYIHLIYVRFIVPLFLLLFPSLNRIDFVRAHGHACAHRRLFNFKSFHSSTYINYIGSFDQWSFLLTHRKHQHVAIQYLYTSFTHTSFANQQSLFLLIHTAPEIAIQINGKIKCFIVRAKSERAKPKAMHSVSICVCVCIGCFAQ